MARLHIWGEGVERPRFNQSGTGSVVGQGQARNRFLLTQGRGNEAARFVEQLERLGRLQVQFLIGTANLVLSFPISRRTCVCPAKANRMQQSALAEA